MASYTENRIAKDHSIALENTRLISELVHVSRIHITAIAALGVFTFGWLFTGRYPWLLTVVCALDWYIVNLLNRLVDFEEDRTNGIVGTIFLQKNCMPILGSVFSLLLASLIVVHYLIPAITGLRIICHGLGIFFNWPLLPGGQRLKNLYFWKNTASGLGFLLTVFGFPIADACWGQGCHNFPVGITWYTVFFSGLFFFLFEISFEVIYDLRDVKGDAEAGIRSYPVVHGVSRAVQIVDGLLFSSMAVLIIGYGLGCIPWRIFIMIAAPVVQFIMYKKAIRTLISPKDCIKLTWTGALMLLTYHLWVAAGLPGAGL